MFSSWKAEGEEHLYIQLAEYIKNLIYQGEMPAGKKIPSIREIAEQTGLSKNTVSNAIHHLSASGYLEVQEKKRPVVLWKQKILSSPDWYDYLSKSKHMPTENIYRDVSFKRGKSSIINAYEVRLGEDFNPGEPVQKVLENISKRVKDIYHHSYFDIKGVAWVREAVCTHLRRYNIFADSSQVLMAQGPLNAMTMISKGLLAYGMSVFLPVPNTLGHLNSFATEGFRVVHIPQDSDGIIPSMLNARTKNSKGILHVNTVSYWPNSVTMSEKRIRDVLEICVKNKIPVMESDMMREYGAEKPPAMPMKSYDSTGNVLYICTFTRPLMPGLRISAIVGPEIVINRLSEMRLQADWSMDIISQLIMGEFLSSGILYEYTDSIRPMIAQYLDETDRLLHRYFDGLARWQKNRNGLNYWVEFDKNIDLSTLNTLKDGVLISPGSLYGDDYKNCLWLCFTGLTLKEFEYVVSTISNAVYAKLRQR